jgi:hypothetical protein
MTDMLRTNWAAKFGLRTVFRAAIGGLLGATLLAAGTPARAGDDLEQVLDAPTKLFDGVLEGLGLQKDGKAMINYQERPPLVIPPSRALPPPEHSDAVIANNPAWPKDPDVQRRKMEAEQEKKNTLSVSEQILNDSYPLSPAKMTPGPKPRTVRKTSTPDPSAGTSWGYSEKMSPKQLGFTGSLWGMMFGKDKKKDSEDVANFTKEPPRTALTEPPPGYQTPSPEQPYGVGKAPPPAPTSRDFMINHPVGEQ